MRMLPPLSRIRRIAAFEKLRKSTDCSGASVREPCVLAFNSAIVVFPDPGPPTTSMWLPPSRMARRLPQISNRSSGLSIFSLGEPIGAWSNVSLVVSFIVREFVRQILADLFQRLRDHLRQVLRRTELDKTLGVAGPLPAPQDPPAKRADVVVVGVWVVCE